jgi:hypothetical protein
MTRTPPSNPDYSETQLVDKLGFTPGDTIFVEDTPEWYSDFSNDSSLDLEPGLPATHAHIFCTTKAELSAFIKENDFADIKKSLWISWPKKSSGQQSDLGENDIRDLVLPTGWVDVKVAAVDNTWSGLKFLRRKV